MSVVYFCPLRQITVRLAQKTHLPRVHQSQTCEFSSYVLSNPIQFHGIILNSMIPVKRYLKFLYKFSSTIIFVTLT